MVEPNPSPATFVTYDEQKQCPLFSTLPAEIRYDIFAYVLTAAPDSTQPIDQEGYCTRPGYETRHRTWTELLRTCRRIYMEAWFMPFLCSEHAFFMASRNRSQSRVITVGEMQQWLDLIHQRHGEVQGGRIRIFAQLWCLEESRFQGIFKMQNFNPKTVTITIRYTDTWFWERNEPLHIAGAWNRDLILPESVKNFNMEIESIEHRKAEVDYIANEAAEKWYFKRADDCLMVADKSTISVSRWTGSSVLGRQRWVRDEVRPGQLDYYVATVSWRPSREALDTFPGPNPKLQVNWQTPPLRNLGMESLSAYELQRMNISLDTPAEEALALWEARIGISDPYSSEEEMDEESDEQNEGQSDEDWDPSDSNDGDEENSDQE
ncbi:hypothetical protein N7474_001073 [Penicillium riverlandense]|uniref:uncharacterized protein n=1 Tax=Penicillium riverlandense TaxID=1903569 RepID=UPI002548536E|nr:uncharacterized protein N7474_001073 [Penicillium riverlandense]KAJ5832762.1 hypothetical protein N7474_001073 [Penicillium riverlandense]